MKNAPCSIRAVSTAAALLLAPLVFAPLTLAASPARGPQIARESRALSLERLSDSGAQGVVELGFDADDVAHLADLHAAGAAFELSALPLPGGLEARLELRPVSAMAPGARAQVVDADGSIRWLAPSVTCFAGSIEGVGEAFLGLSAGQAHGYFRVGSELYFLSSGGSARGRATLAHASQTASASSAFCHMVGGPDAAQPDSGGRESLVAPNLKVADVFIEADRAYRQSFASEQACVDYSVLLLTAASEIYRRDLGARLNIPNGYLRVWNTTAPWGVIDGFADLSKVYTWWQSSANPQQALPRAAVHVLTHPVFGGTARGVAALCSDSRAYEISSVAGHFPYPREHTDRENWDLYVVTHEFGHTFGSMHSADYSPPIGCLDGSGPDQGTIMSYCNQEFGTAGVGMRFHLREQERIRGHMSAVACLRSLTLVPGDYDADGVRDANDLAAANSVLNQGFRSLGAEDVLDMDGDDDFDVRDRDALAALIAAPPASATPRNGSGVNPMCLSTLDEPVLGSTFRVSLQANVGQLVGLMLYDLPHPGLPTAFGEFLIRPSAQGGHLLFASARVATSPVVAFDVQIPADLALNGSRAVLQGAVVGPTSGTQLCNALDLVLSLYP
jgi:hypothetical protein